jgi:hypothetical protein
MNDVWKTVLWQQLGASIDMLENAINDTPTWITRTKKPL